MNKASTDRKASAAIYRNAAKGMERSHDPHEWDAQYSCLAILEAGGGDDKRAAYVEVFAPEGPYHPETNLQYAFGLGVDDEAKNLRILALCFMAAMVEAGDA